VRINSYLAMVCVGTKCYAYAVCGTLCNTQCIPLWLLW